MADGDKAETIAISALQSGIELDVLYARVIAPALWRIGDLGEQQAISIVDEHLATAITLKVMARIYGLGIDAKGSKPGRLLLATAEGQRHDIGLRMAGDVLELAGYEVIFLGGDVPTDSLLESVRRFLPDLVAISSILDANESLAERQIRELVRNFPETPVLVGGPAAPEAVFGENPVVRSDGIEHLADTVDELLCEWGIAPDRPPISTEPRPASDSSTNETAAEHMLQVVADSSEETRAQARLAHSFRQLAYEDATTAGPNRRAFDDHLESLNSNVSAQPVCLMILDIDSFKEVNDSLGHEAGDRLLRDVARTIKANLRVGDFAARLGGDEFGILLPRSQPHDALPVAERILEEIRDLAGELPVAATIGIARLDGDPRQALIRADAALYEAKDAGKDQVRVAAQN